MANPRRPTIRDVAAAAGVSVTTVSHVINGKGRTDAGTRERVFAVASRLGYAPSRAARRLRGGRTQTIGLMLPSFGVGDRTDSRDKALGLDNYMRIVGRAASSAHAREHALLLLPPEAGADDLHDVDMDGAVIVDPATNDGTLGSLDELGIPFVSIERDAGRPDVPWHVSLDASQGVRLALEHLRGQRAGRICLLAPDADWAYSTNVVEAFRALTAELDLDGVVIGVPVAHLEGGAYQVAGLALDATSPPDAIIALTERFAGGVARAAAERELRIPEDLLLMSGADSYHVREATPTVTALDMQPELAAEEAVAMLIARLNGEEPEAPRVIPYRLLVRDSTRRSPEPQGGDLPA